MIYGWPVNYSLDKLPQYKLHNHKGALDFEKDVGLYIKRELEFGSNIGLFDRNPLQSTLTISPLNLVSKKKIRKRGG